MTPIEWLTLGLILLTAWYAYSTDRLLKESQKSREEMEKSRRIDLLKERLGNLYYPLKYNERYFKSPNLDNLYFTEDVVEFFQNTQRYSYLASEKLFKLLPPLLIMTNDMIKEGAVKFKVKYQQKLSEMGDTILDQVKIDCLKYEGELDKLIGK